VYTCRECEKPINQATEICPYCGADLTGAGPDQPDEPARKRSLASILLRWVILVGALGAALWGFLWYVLPERGGDPAARAELQAVAALRELHAELSDFAAAQRGALPAALETLGDRARGPAQKALSGGYRLEYTPGPVSGDGAVHNYVLLARPGNYGYRNFYLDESGVIRATRENRTATAQDPPI
jgi:hypothetical protein